ncbi:hypothetical protein HK414_18965 [Ramlibacter terrae]|uniref:Uncharacterized protein n=1 Tax=Ramlibacter terrae TaxID=2732511 RepID=A0ABX6P5D9_9BURK|nr:hypothetical protein HK414_18965 [Ramlibacter terrae]
MKSQLFYLAAVDGVPVASSLQATRAATYGMGLSLRTRYVQHDVPARPVRLRIVGTHVSAAPIRARASRGGRFLAVEGAVEFHPVAGKEYVIHGRLAKGDAYVCVADGATGECISAKATQLRK